jgi:hypothetical protein
VCGAAGGGGPGWVRGNVGPGGPIGALLAGGEIGSSGAVGTGGRDGAGTGAAGEGATKGGSLLLSWAESESASRCLRLACLAGARRCSIRDPQEVEIPRGEQRGSGNAGIRVLAVACAAASQRSVAPNDRIEREFTIAR